MTVSIRELVCRGFRAFFVQRAHPSSTLSQHSRISLLYLNFCRNQKRSPVVQLNWSSVGVFFRFAIKALTQIYVNGPLAALILSFAESHPNLASIWYARFQAQWSFLCTPWRRRERGRGRNEGETGTRKMDLLSRKALWRLGVSVFPYVMTGESLLQRCTIHI